MTIPAFLSSLYTHVRARPLWAFAYLATCLMPVMLVFARAGAEICCALIGLLFLWHSAATRDWQWLRTPFARVACAAWLWLVLVVTPLSFDPVKGLADALFWFRLPLMVVALRFWVLAEEQPRGLFYRGLLVFLTLVMVDTLWQLVTGMSLTGHPTLESLRLTGPFTNPKVGYFLSKLMLIPLAVLLVSAWQKKNMRQAVGLGVLLLVFTLTILFTGERAAFLTVVMALLATGGLMVLVNKRLLLPLMVAATGLAMGVAALVATSDRVQDRAVEAVGKFDDFATSDYGLIFNAAIDMSQEHWLHGTGIRGFDALSPMFELPEGGLFHGLHPHNAYLEWLVEAGLLGMVLYATLAGTLFWLVWQHFRAARGPLCLLPAVAIAVLLQHFFPLMPMQSAFKNWSALLVWYSAATALAALPLRRDSSL